MKHKTLKRAAASFAGFHLALSAFTFYEVLNRNAKLPGKINTLMKKPAKKAAQNKPQDKRVEWMHNQDFVRYEITNSRGEKLRAHYLPAENNSKLFLLGSHGYRNRGKGEFRFISKFYHDIGYNILLPDHVASGESEGDYIGFGHFEAPDLLEWLEFLKKEFGDDIQIALHGFSMGSATVCMLSKEKAILPNVKFIVADCGFTTAVEQFSNVLKDYKVPSTLLLSTVDVICRLVMGMDFKKLRPVEDVKSAVVPMLFVHGKNDTFVKYEMVHKLFDACTAEKDILTVEGAGHTQSYVKNTAEYEKKVIEFTEKYMKKETVSER